jgi:hypothetical protein
MGGSNPNTSQQLSPLNVGSGVRSNPIDIESTRPWEIQSPHSEKIAEGIAQGVSNFAMGLAALKAAQKPNAAGGFDTKGAAKQAAPYASGISQDAQGNFYPQAQGVNYQPDQIERLYGYNYSGTGY